MAVLISAILLVAIPVTLAGPADQMEKELVPFDWEYGNHLEPEPNHLLII